MVDYRPLPDSALDTFQSYLSYAFNPTGDPYDPAEEDELPPPATVGDRRGLFDGEDLRSVCVHHYFDTRVRGSWHDVAGLSAVATPPEYRRQGHIATLLEASLAEYRDRDVFLSTLWPFSAPFYGKYGWAMAHRYAVQTGPPEALSNGRHYADGSFFEAEKDDWAALHEVMMAHGERYDLTVDRTEEWWRKRVFHSWRRDPYVYAWERDGTVEGYVAYTVEETDDGDSQIQVWDMAWVDHRARMNLLRFLANHQDQIDSVRLSGPADSLVMDAIDDPARMSYEIQPGPMVRIVDLNAAVEALDYPESLTGSLTVGVRDPLVEANDGRFEVAFESGDASVSETTADPDVEFDIGSLSQLYLGYLDIHALQTVGDVAVRNEEAVDLLETAYPERNIFLREHF